MYIQLRDDARDGSRGRAYALRPALPRVRRSGAAAASMAEPPRQAGSGGAGERVWRIGFFLRVCVLSVCRKTACDQALITLLPITAGWCSSALARTLPLIWNADLKWNWMLYIFLLEWGKGHQSHYVIDMDYSTCHYTDTNDSNCNILRFATIDREVLPIPRYGSFVMLLPPLGSKMQPCLQRS